MPFFWMKISVKLLPIVCFFAAVLQGRIFFCITLFGTSLIFFVS